MNEDMMILIGSLTKTFGFFRVTLGGSEGAREGGMEECKTELLSWVISLCVLRLPRLRLDAGPVGVRRVRLQAEQRLKPNRGSCCRCTENASRSTRVLGRVSHKSGRAQNNATTESGMKIVDEMFAVGKPDSRETLTLTIVRTEGH